MMKRSVSLCDVDLAALIGSADPEVRIEAEAARARLDAPARWPNTPAHAAALVVDVVDEAKREGRLLFRSVAVSYCRYCDARSTWEKSKRRRKSFEAKIGGVEFAYRFVVIAGHISVGACRTCVEQALPVLRAELSKFPVQLPANLRTDAAPIYQRWERCRCRKCEWRGHEGQLGKLPALMEGWYPGKCPSCGAERKPFGENPFESLDGFDVVEESPP